MGKYKYTTEKVKEVAKIKSPNLDIIGEFSNISDDIMCNCSKNENHKNFMISLQKILYRGDGCPYCSGKRVCYEDSLEYNYPNISKQWDYKKNKELTPDKVLPLSNKRVSWVCDLDHEWDTVIAYRVNDNSGCPYCANKKVLVGFNDLWSTEPLTAKLLLHKEYGYTVTRQSDKRADWVCADCGNIIKNKTIANIVSHGLSCNKCSDGFSYPSKLVYNLLLQLGIDFETEKRFDWCKFYMNNKLKQGVYDFYFKKDGIKYLIEVDGALHFKENDFSNTSLSDIKFIDCEKDRLALENGCVLFRIDCQVSDLEYIRKNIMESQLRNVLNISIVDWNKCNSNAIKSKIFEVIELWNPNIKFSKNIKFISESLKISEVTIRKYIKMLPEKFALKGA